VSYGGRTIAAGGGGRNPWAAAAREEGRPSFLQKRSKKRFSVLSRTQRTKVFWFFFSKKNCFLPFVSQTLFTAPP
jgi:hypothetical protein